MPRVLSRSVLREIRKQELMPIEIIDVALTPPFSLWEYRFANLNQSIIFDGETYTPLGFSRGDYETESGEAVDRITVNLDDTAGFWSEVVQRQVIQGSRVRLRKIFLGYTSKASDAITIFDGFFGAPRFDDDQISIEVRSILSYLNSDVPPRVFSPGCPYQLGSARCGVDMTDPANTVEPVRGGPGSTQRRLRSPHLGAFQTRYFDAGYVYAIEGKNAGQVRPIKTSAPISNGAYGEVELFVPFPFPMEGGVYRVVRGCRKTKPDCAVRFNNRNSAGQLRFGGFPEVPKTPAVEVAAT